MLVGIVQLIRTASMTLPVAELTILILILTVCLVFRFNRTGIITSYVFTYRWGWLFFIGHEQKYLVMYLVFGVVAGVLAVVGMLRAAK